MSKKIRAEIAAKLMALPEAWQLNFRSMYKPKGANPEAVSNAECIASISPPRLAWALMQINNSLRKLIQEGKGTSRNEE